jgi:hypothetical protein
VALGIVGIEPNMIEICDPGADFKHAGVANPSANLGAGI